MVIGTRFFYMQLLTFPIYQIRKGFVILDEIIKQNPMFELTKKILVRVSFDPLLFQKELSKAIKWISDSEEIQHLRDWCMKEFGAVYPSIIQKAFSTQKAK
ncbi:hypothetical protein Fluta_1826 [Fluviicola taffensis DSM 16823]|uniref:Uncharacterized protein n=2 Tax=Fluviicola TaxID=332102 RepID=F2IIA4_FLUTR|nr:hypothetical protein Fluta_1826 [Fluviicola taffensis DSM 16823]